ncbi:unnamed protein product [Neofusicoccum parvum]|uniref:Unnamed protein product n=1 Tax=Neofusicoccum parvum TaxID=310453 RepID=A0ACB5SJY7_9PEZI|nr:unnamed protein product [Neofusicoccum parvum]GME44989.1 unnamed protein product [Neofusicoccum parvum]
MPEKTALSINPTTETTDAVTPNIDNGLSVTYVIDPEEERKVLKKLDRVVLPLMALVYFFQFLDKHSINFAAVFGLSEDLSLSGGEFSWVISLYYFGQFCSEYPAAYLMSRLRITRFVGVTIILWGAIEMCLGASQGFPSLGAIRFLLGLAEGSVSPSFMIITSCWYKRSEHPIRVATWMSMFGVAETAGGLIMYGIGIAHMSMQNWRVMFLACGGLTVLAGILFMVYMPLDPTTAWFLNERERLVATERLALDRGTRDGTDFNWNQAKEALLDPRTLTYVMMAFFITIPSPILKFSAQVIHGFGYSAVDTMLVGLPGGAFAFALTWIGALGPLYFRNSRCFFGIFMASVPMLGSLLLLLLPASTPWGIVASTWLASCMPPVWGQVLALIASNVKGNTKKSVVGALAFIFFCVGNITAPQLWQREDAPRYLKGCIASVASYCCLIIAFFGYYLVGKYSNEKEDRRFRFAL